MDFNIFCYCCSLLLRVQSVCRWDAFMLIEDPFDRGGFAFFDFNDLLKLSLSEYPDIAEYLMGKLSDEDIQDYTEEYEKKETMFFMYNGAERGVLFCFNGLLVIDANSSACRFFRIRLLLLNVFKPKMVI